MKRKTDKDYGLQTEFERIVREHKATIYTVCYMFSDDNATVADMPHQYLERTGEFPGEEQCGHMDMEGQPQHLHFIREEAQAQA